MLALAGNRCDGCSRRCRRRHRQCPPPERAEAAFDAPARTAVHPHGPGHVYAPQRTAPEDGQGRGSGARRELRAKATGPSTHQEAVTVGSVAAPGPLLEVSSMAGGDSVDDTALRFLVKKALERQKEEEEQAKVKRLKEENEERRMKRINAKVCDDIPLTHEEHEAWKRWIVACASSSSSSGKKRRKRKLPKSSSSRSALVVDIGSGMLQADFPGFDAAVACARLVSLVLFLALCSRRRYWQWYVLAGFAGYDTPRAVFPSTVLVLPEVYRIMDCSGRSLQEWFPYATLLGSTADTCTASVYGAFRRRSHIFHVVDSAR